MQQHFTPCQLPSARGIITTFFLLLALSSNPEAWPSDPKVQFGYSPLSVCQGYLLYQLCLAIIEIASLHKKTCGCECGCVTREKARGREHVTPGPRCVTDSEPFRFISVCFSFGSSYPFDFALNLDLVSSSPSFSHHPFRVYPFLSYSGPLPLLLR